MRGGAATIPSEAPEKIPVDVFLHIPKTAGDTLMTILWREYRERGYLEVSDSLQVPEDSIERTVLQRAQRKLRESGMGRPGLLYGHMPFGIHETVGEPVRYFSMVRDPVERVVSHYHYVKREARHPLHKHVTEDGMTLHEYVTSGISDELTNGQTALLAGDVGDASRDDDSLLRRAQTNIERHFLVVGITEEFDRSVILFKLALGWEKPVVYRSINVTAGRPAISAQPQETIDEIGARNQLDEALVRFVRQRFDAQIEDAAAAVRRELRRMRLENALYRHGPQRALREGWTWTRRFRR